MKNLLLILLSAAILSAAPAGSETGKQEVLAAMDAYKNAMVQKDGAALKKLLADDLTYVHSTGSFETKSDVIKAITTPTTIVEKIEFFPETTVRIHGNTAYVNGKVDLWHSTTNVVHMQVLHVWEKTPQGWQMVARQATKIAK
ncbi:MAG: nuclear transport factor 2 family protein [Bryobacteraceae bacterium]